MPDTDISHAVEARLQAIEARLDALEGDENGDNGEEEVEEPDPYSPEGMD